MQRGLQHLPLPLAGIRVVELGQLVAGPFCGCILGSFGAEVSDLPFPIFPSTSYFRGLVVVWVGVTNINEIESENLRTRMVCSAHLADGT